MRDVDIDGPVYDKWGVQPKRLDDLAAREKRPLILDQECQNLIFLSGKQDLAAFEEDFLGIQIDRQGSAMDQSCAA